MTLSAGDIWLLLAALSASFGYVVSGKLSQRMPGWEVICWSLVLTAPASIVGTIATVHQDHMQATPAHIFAFFYLGLGSMFLGFFAWNVGLAMGGIARVSQVQLLQSSITLVISAALLGETVTTETILFALAIIVVVALGRKARVTRQ